MIGYIEEGRGGKREGKKVCCSNWGRPPDVVMLTVQDHETFKENFHKRGIITKTKELT